MPAGRAIRVAVIDDHPAIALAIEAAIQADRSSEARSDGDGRDDQPIEFAGSARTVEAAGELLSTAHPDVVLCDIQLQRGLDGLDAVELVISRGARAIVLTSFDRASLMRAAFERGASGFLDKATEPRDIVAAVLRVANGGTAFSSEALDAARFAPRAPSDREIEILGHIQRGATSDEIGKALGISTRTVESHLRRLFDRYGVVSRTELAMFALNQGWLDAGR